MNFFGYMNFRCIFAIPFKEQPAQMVKLVDTLL